MGVLWKKSRFVIADIIAPELLPITYKTKRIYLIVKLWPTGMQLSHLLIIPWNILINRRTKTTKFLITDDKK